MSNSDIISSADKALRPVLKELGRFPWIRLEGCCAGHKAEDSLWLETNVLGSSGLRRLIELLKILDGKLAGTDCRQSSRQSVPASFPSRIFKSSISRRSPDDPSTLVSSQRLSSALCPAQQPSKRIQGNLPSSFRTGLSALSALLIMSELDILEDNLGAEMLPAAWTQNGFGRSVNQKKLVFEAGLDNFADPGDGNTFDDFREIRSGN